MALKIDIKDLLTSTPTLQLPGVRFGWPDDPTPVNVSDPKRFSTNLDAVLRAIHDLRGGKHYLVNAEVNCYHKSVWIRFVGRGACEDRNGQVEPESRRCFGLSVW